MSSPTQYYPVLSSAAGAAARVYFEILISALTVTHAEVGAQDQTGAQFVIGETGLVSPGPYSSAPLAVGQIIGFAYDRSSGYGWLNIDGGAWIGGGDPSAGTSPTFTGISGSVFALAQAYTATTAAVFQGGFNLVDLEFPVPSGFTSLSGV